jgi:hypothetical protein
MKKRPISIKLISLIYILLPLHIYAQIAYFSNTPWDDVLAVISKFSLHAYVLSILWVVVGFCIFMVKRWSWYVFLAHSISMIMWNCYFAMIHPHFPIVLTLTFLAGLFLVTGFFILEPIRAPYFNPRLRWWEQEKRYRIDLPVTIIYPELNNTIEGKTYDISRSGLFFTGDLEGPTGTDIQVKFQHELLVELDISGEIVWITTGKGRYPKGGGIKFYSMPKEQYKQLGKILTTLNFR